MRSFFCFVIFLGLGGQVFAQKTGTPTLSKTASASVFMSPIDRIHWERLHPYISTKYLRGNFLIYDCEDHHFACVEEKNYLDCKQKREFLLIRGEEKMPCAAFKEYPTYSLCIKKQYELMYSGSTFAFCFKPNLN